MRCSKHSGLCSRASAAAFDNSSRQVIVFALYYITIKVENSIRGRLVLPPNVYWSPQRHQAGIKASKQQKLFPNQLEITQ